MNFICAALGIDKHKIPGREGFSLAVYLAELFVSLKGKTAFQWNRPFSCFDTEKRTASMACREAWRLRGFFANPLCRQPLSAFEPAASQHVAAVGRLHPLAEAMYLFALPSFRLVGLKHLDAPLFRLLMKAAGPKPSAYLYH